MKNFLLWVCFASMAGLFACSSGKSAYERGNYYEAVMNSVNRLRRNADHKKSIESLRNSYPMAVKYYEDQAKFSLSANKPFKWGSVVQSYTYINNMYDEIQRSPGALAVIPNPVNYFDRLQEARQNAAEENYVAGVQALSVGSREKAKEAFGFFENAEKYVPGYKDINSKKEEALWAATLKVVVEPIPIAGRNVALSTEFFNDKISEFVHTAPINQFVRFFSIDEAKSMNLRPDQIIQLSFDDFVVGQVYHYEKEIQMERDSVLVALVISGKQVDVSKSGAGREGGNNTSTRPGQNSSGGNNNGQGNSGQGNKKDGGDEEKVTICHIPPGNGGKRTTLFVPKSAVSAHMAHGDKLGYCDDYRGNKGTDGNNKKSGGGGGLGFNNPSPFSQERPVLTASLEYSILEHGLQAQGLVDSTKIYQTVKAKYNHHQKVIISKGVVNFRIVDAQNNALLTAEKMPGEFYWVSEWANFNGDERALTPEQLEITRQREATPPPPQDLFIEFTRPIYDQITNKIREFYKRY